MHRLILGMLCIDQWCPIRVDHPQGGLEGTRRCS